MPTTVNAIAQILSQLPYCNHYRLRYQHCFHVAESTRHSSYRNSHGRVRRGSACCGARRGEVSGSADQIIACNHRGGRYCTRHKPLQDDEHVAAVAAVVENGVGEKWSAETVSGGGAGVRCHPPGGEVHATHGFGRYTGYCRERVVGVVDGRGASDDSGVGGGQIFYISHHRIFTITSTRKVYGVFIGRREDKNSSGGVLRPVREWTIGVG